MNVKFKLLRRTSRRPESHNGNWHDCYVSGAAVLKAAAVENWGFDWRDAIVRMQDTGVIHYQPGDIVVLFLGFSAQMEQGYEGHILPRSSTFTKYGLLLSNAMGIVDDTYCGDEDEWRAVMYATKEGHFRVGERLVQISFQKTLNVTFERVETLGNENRGGYGSTGN